MNFMNQNSESALKQTSSYVSPLIRVVEMDMSLRICQSSDPSTYFYPEIDELP